VSRNIKSTKVSDNQ